MFNRFLDYVEIRTKITSTFTFFMTIALLLYQKRTIDWKLSLLFFASMFLFDLTTTAINNYIDSKGNGQKLPFDRKTALILVYVLLGLSILTGLLLAWFTDIVILIAGGFCFLCGILYTYGPVPISRQPLGEVLSGAFYGILIPFILFYINAPKGTYVLLSLNFNTVSFTLQVVPILSLLIYSVIPFCVTANIMLANNICDMEKDILVKRHTLPYYIGRKSALVLFALLYYMTYAAVIVMVIVKILSPVCLLSLLTIIAVQGNINKFNKKQEKSTTFILSIRNFIIIMGSNGILIFLSSFLR
ncbi:UbiA family prenyltransferase [Anaerocolumna sp. AGMB13025]|uniref:UbiA family prenyltransferase n=1 Tax=Anaerocolumna sp. AGMB13025 TaxID=3039116 RepID=UPI00241DA55B|nr:UbiA family prenyltransferase [Anaerocolumna sp. AGMB13025]WFR57782.1 UbiA family prenyltransferase [Anaerocolumna sp. AGMB13025]